MSDETVNTLPPPHTGFQRYQKKKNRGHWAFRSRKSTVNFQVHTRQSLSQMGCWCSETLRDFSPVRLFYS